MWSTNIGIDLGTSSVLVYIRKKGIVLREPSVVVVNTQEDNQVVAVGEEARKMIGRTLQVLVEGRIPEEDVYVGRTYRDAPDVDGYIFLKAEEELMSGDMVTARVTGADAYDLTGEVLYEFTE